MKRVRDKKLPLNQKNSTKEPNKKKSRLTKNQSEIMQDFYLDTSRYPTPEQYTTLSKQLKIDRTKALSWFHNKRSRDRKSRTGGQLKLDYFKTNPFWNQRIEFPSPPPKYKYSGELLLRYLAVRATEALKRDIEIKTSSFKYSGFSFSSHGSQGLNEITPSQSVDDSILGFEKLCKDFHSSDLRLEYINCLYPLLSKIDFV